MTLRTRTTLLPLLGLLASFAHAGTRVPAPDASQGDGRVSAFYTWEKDIPAKPGQLLRSEPLPKNIGLDSAAEQVRILYSSTDGFDSKTPIAVSGAVFIPKGKAPEGGWPVIAWAHGTVGLADICAPSWAGRSYRDSVYLNRWLSEGFAVVATDYQGLGTPGPHPLINIPAISYGVLDSVRAALAGVPGLANKVVIVGQSQGGAAAFGAAAYAPTYAPDINLKGAVGTGVIYRRAAGQPPLPSTSLPNDPYKVDEAIAYSLYGFQVDRQFDPALQPSDVFTEKAVSLVELAQTSCLSSLSGDVVFGGFTRANTFLAEPSARYKAFLARANERTQRYSVYPTLKLKAPIFIGTGASDVTPAAVNQLALIKDACDAGSVVEGHLYAGLGHSATVNASLRDSIPFVKKVIAGEKIQPVCQPVLQ
ncbi:MAG: hypothetical protein GAK37_02412 [Pseudomonas sp.]|nr:MAG: hypothetical protein GAK37_02412 [Pseudomonas sp.]